PGNQQHIQSLTKAGVFGFKAFLTHSGIDDFPNVSESDLRMAIPEIKKSGLPLLVHAELESSHADQDLLENNPFSYAAYLKSRPKQWEDNAIQLMINLCKEFKQHTHIVHLSSSNSIAQLTKAIDNGLPISVETCPHYLFFNAEEIGDGQTQFKCAPPIRERANNDALWKAVKDGLISFIVTDHSPAPPDLKELETGNFKKAWGGIAGLEFSLPAFWTKAKDKGFTLVDVASLMSTNVARFLGLENQKGKIAKGFDADMVVWHPEKKFRVNKDEITFRHKITPFEDQLLYGLVERTYVGGQKVFEDEKFHQLNGGRILTRKYNG
ncbi:MAG TPA: amidohydrolase family protein, partial [Cyclobacteriaceae bacterium]|nr:amidohydrolase family protein [Cyclobacteriaceae bacterium]